MGPITGMTATMRTHYAALLASDETGTAAVLHWREATMPDGYDPNDETSAAGGTLEARTQEFRCFFHQVEARASGFQKFLEIETGDVILDYMAELQLEGKQDLRVEVGGNFYVQKSAGKKLLEYWETQSAAGGLCKVMLLTPAG